MFKQFPYEKLEYALDLYIATTEKRLPTAENQAPSPTGLPEQYDEKDLMTIKEAIAYIPIGRTKLYEMRKADILDTIERNGRQKRLVRAQVETLRTWSRNKGKW